MASNVTDPDRPANDAESWFAPGAVLTDDRGRRTAEVSIRLPAPARAVDPDRRVRLAHRRSDPIRLARSDARRVRDHPGRRHGRRSPASPAAASSSPTRSGRTTAYAMTDRCAWMVAEGRRLTLDFTGAMRSWDGRWTLVSYSIAQERRAQRALLRTRLRWLGFAPMQDGLWVSPRPPGQLLHEALADLGVGSCAVFVADPVPGSRPARSAVGMGSRRGACRVRGSSSTSSRPVSENLRSGRVSASEALIARTRLTYRWFAFANSQAELPEALLPADWPGAVARRLFEELYDGLGPLAALRDHAAHQRPRRRPRQRRHVVRVHRADRRHDVGAS